MYKRQRQALSVYKSHDKRTVSKGYESTQTFKGRCEILRTVCAVSYTHLDVYKRQDKMLINEEINNITPVICINKTDIKKREDIDCLLYTSRCV